MKLQISTHLKLRGKKVLLIDSNQPTRDVRASVLRSRGVEVHVAKSLRAARFVWQRSVYDMILVDVRRHLPGEALEFYEQIKDANPRERFAFLVGPPVYISLTWPEELMTWEKEPEQWAKAVRRLMAVA
jgi:CheY-like chemotaxis protein